uniref:Uncharacterized protein n=1 Tax=Aegilops tauschii subsp. strangulata TaxID=200361 RepID=A0A453IAU0_AEGTS
MVFSEVGEVYSRKLASFVEKRLKSERTASVSMPFVTTVEKETYLLNICATSDSDMD